MEVRVGIGVCIFKDGKVLLGCRKGSHGENTWCFPGGHLEFKETWKECAIRETKEETDLEIDNIELMGITNDIFENENKHYITIFMKASYKSGDLKIMEPEKCIEWIWFEPNKLPEPLFVPIENYIKNYGQLKIRR